MKGCAALRHERRLLAPQEEHARRVPRMTRSLTLVANSQNPQFCLGKAYVKSGCLRHCRQFATSVFVLTGPRRRRGTSPGDVAQRVSYMTTVCPHAIKGELV